MNFSPTKPSPTTTLNAGSAKNQCSNCGFKNRWLLHHVQLRGIDRLLCTSCVLRLHPSSFCPSCFEFFDHPLSSTSSASAHRFLSCIKCSSLTHIQCLPSPPPPPPPPHSSFLCPPCSTPNFFFFDLDKPDSGLTKTRHVLDKKLALVLLCAAKIAFASMNKAVTVARAKADRTVREAALARKRAKEALQQFSVVLKVRRIEGSVHVVGSRNLGARDRDKIPKVTDPGLKSNGKKEDFIGCTRVHKAPSLCTQNVSSVTAKEADQKNVAPDSFGSNGTTSGEDKSKNDGKLGNNERLGSSHGTMVDVSSV